jgi:hypothetical protein
MGSRSIVIENAVSGHAGATMLHLKESSGQASLLSDWQGIPRGELKVDVTTFDNLIADFGVPQFAKIDVEGAEPNVLSGLSHRIPVVTLEYHCDERGAEHARHCVDLLLRQGSVEINFTGQERYELLLSSWLRPSEFMKRFPDCTGQHFYGDMIVRAV